METHLDDPVDRLRAIADTAEVSKDHNSELGANLLQDWSQFMDPTVFGTAMRAYSALRLAERHPVIHNLVVSNVPGSPVPLYFLGARITAMYPFGPIFDGAALNVTVLSVDGKIDVGAIACSDLVPDLWELVDAFPHALDELLAAAEVHREGSGTDSSVGESRGDGGRNRFAASPDHPANRQR
jgi:diacylglycerol O-acyltransferase / wax synthase